MTSDDERHRALFFFLCEHYLPQPEAVTIALAWGHAWQEDVVPQHARMRALDQLIREHAATIAEDFRRLHPRLNQG